MYSCDGFINIQVPDPLEVGAAGPLGGFIWLFEELFFWLKAWTVFAVANKVVKPYLSPTRQKLLPFIFFSLLLVFILYPFSTLMSFIIIIINSYHLKKSLDVPSWRHLKGGTGTMHWVCVPNSTSLFFIWVVKYRVIFWLVPPQKVLSVEDGKSLPKKWKSELKLNILLLNRPTFTFLVGILPSSTLFGAEPVKNLHPPPPSCC